MTSQPHTTCTHPSTSSARAKCRAQRKSTEFLSGSIDDLNAKVATDPKMAKKVGFKAEKVAEANAKRATATRAKNPLKPRGECFECGGKAGWIDDRNDEPVCIKHVDYDHIKAFVAL